MSCLPPITPNELNEARRVLAIVPVSDVPPESYTCFQCVGRRLVSESTLDEIDNWVEERKFNPQAKTLCGLAWDPYNVDGDCLASK